MKPPVLRFTLLAMLGVFLCPPVAGHASSPPADSTHFCLPAVQNSAQAGVPFDYEQWRRDHPRPAAKPLADLNAGEPRTVRLILFLPNDRPFRVGLVDSIKTAIKQSQTFFAEQMQAHGYGYKTFRIETDALGEPLVHRVNGQHPESHYFEKTPGVLHGHWTREIEQVFDLEENVYVIYRDITKYTGSATGYRYTKKRGTANLPATAARWGVLSHELAHAFGLPHDYRDGAYILSYGGPSQFPGTSTWDRISACAAEFLSVHPYFDSAIPIEEVSPPTIKLISPSKYPGGSKSVSIEFEVSDAEGLHQVLLYTNTAYGYGGLRECRALEGRRDAVVEFDYDGSSTAADPERAITSLSDSLHSVDVRVVDTDGNVTALEFNLVPDQVTDALKGHTDSVHTVAFSPDRTTLASGSSDGTVKLWNVSRRELLATLEGHTHSVRTVAFSRNGILASGSLNGIRLWDVTTQSEIAVLEGTAPVAFSPDGTLLASGSGNRTIALWDARTLEKVATLEGHTEQINTVAFSPDGTLLASGSGNFGSEDQTVRLWDVARREEIATFEHTGAIWSVAFSPDGAVLASAVGSPENVVWMWDVRTRREVTRLWHSGAVWSVVFSRGASILASGFISDRGDGKVRLYDPLTLDLIGTFLPFQPRRGGVRSLAISHDETTLAAGTEYHTIELRDVSKWKRPPFPFRLEVISGDGQQGAPGAALAHPLIVEVRDQYGDPLPDASVTFTVTAGGGTLSVETAATDANGRAATLLTLGSQQGKNTVVATVAHLEPETSTATAKADPDFDGDGTVGFADFVQFAAQFGLGQGDAGYDARYDLDGDGAIGFGDFVIFANAFGKNQADGPNQAPRAVENIADQDMIQGEGDAVLDVSPYFRDGDGDELTFAAAVERRIGSDGRGIRFDGDNQTCIAGQCHGDGESNGPGRIERHAAFSG